MEVVKLEPYETKKVKLTLSPRDFAVIEEDGSCVAVPGIYEISAGGQQPDDRSTKLQASGQSALRSQDVERK
ncbi:MAG: fibronectin type III-like domain-contianing protein [Agathobacter rectalis]